ncbi:MAG: tRNA pseudouridine(38-40) synthase TruA, partial [Propionibacterium sp.]|nr:tRNA pseudouridine(38-40) synthase TruA [Propionibacterium sp.]
MRLRIDLAYDGREFHGWARQPGQRTVQGELELWTTRVLRLAEPAQVVVAGRTDAGVHARGQVAHVDLPAPGEGDDVASTLLHRLRRVLPDDIVVHRVTPAPAGFDARFSAAWRRYSYRVVEQDAPPDPLLRGHVIAVPQPVDVERLNELAPLLLGLRDFAPFCKPRDGATTIRELRELGARRRDDGVVEIHLLADAFCHSMVRSLVGALLAAAGGRRDAAWL